MNEKELREYRKTWYWKITGFGGEIPDNWISGKKIRIFGINMGILWKIARPNYKWAKN